MCSGCKGNHPICPGPKGPVWLALQSGQLHSSSSHVQGVVPFTAQPQAMHAAPLVSPVPLAGILTCTSCTYRNRRGTWEGNAWPLKSSKRCPAATKKVPWLEIFFFILFFNRQLLCAFVQSHRNFILGPVDNHSTSLPSFQPHNHFS